MSALDESSDSLQPGAAASSSLDQSIGETPPRRRRSVRSSHHEPSLATSTQASPIFPPLSVTPVRPIAAAGSALFPPPQALFQSPSPALRYNPLQSAASSGAVMHQSGSETTVFTPLQGSRGKMFDAQAGSVLIEDYGSAAPSPAAAPSAAFSPSPSFAAPSNAVAAPVPARGFSSLLGSWSSLFGGGGSNSNTNIVASSSSSMSTTVNRTSTTPSGTTTSTTQKTTTSMFSFLTLARAPSAPLPPTHPTPPPSVTMVSAPPSKPSSPAPSGAAELAPSSSPGFSASGPCILEMPPGLVALPLGQSPGDIVARAELLGLYDPEFTNRASAWNQLIAPGQIRRQFNPNLYLKLLSAGAPASSASAAASSVPATPAAAGDDSARTLSSSPSFSTVASPGDDSAGGGADGDADAGLLVSSFDSATEVCIRKDLARTFPQLPLFRHRVGLSTLYNVLRAFARFDPAVGYSQGLGFIVGILIVHCGPPFELVAAENVTAANANAAAAAAVADESEAGASVAAAAASSSSSSLVSSASFASSTASAGAADCSSEELLFWSLVSLMQGRKHNLRAIYTDDCVGLRHILDILSEALAESDPSLATHLSNQGVEVSLFATSWFVSCFSYRFDLKFTTRVWDNFLNVGQSFLVVVALGILRHVRAAILAKNFEQIMPYVSQTMIPELPEDLPDQAFHEIELPLHLRDKLQPKQMMQGSYKKRR